MQLLTRIRRTIRRHGLAQSDTRVVVALSGGPDSVALAYLLRSLDEAGELQVVGLAHFNHQLRAGAGEDERFCEQAAAALGVPLLSDRGDVKARAARERRSIEDAARVERYAFLERARAHFDADVIALGHTRDDQAETFLLRLLRGAAARGLAAMHPRRGRFIRPLLECRRAELVAFLDSRSLSYVTDETNGDVGIPRNRIRAELVPLIERRFNPSIVDVLADEAEIAREEWRWMSAAAASLAADICRRERGRWWIDVEHLNRAPVALARLLLQDVMREAAPGRTVPFAHVEAALRLARGEGSSFDASAHRVERIGADLVLTNRAAPAGRTLFEYSLSIPGEVELPEAGVIVSAQVAASAVAGGVLGGRDEVAVRRDRCQGTLIVRNRRPGDRFRPLGLEGRKKLQDYFVDRKVARIDRDVVPLVVDESDRIVWVAGHSIDAEFRVTDPAQAVLILRVRQV